jgi:hypothetical protein
VANAGTALIRVVVVDSGIRREVTLQADAPVRDALESGGVPLRSRSVLVVAADGGPVDLDSPPRIPDGALLTVVDVPSARRAQSMRRESPPSSRVDLSGTVWVVVAIAATIATFAVTDTAGPPQGVWASLVRYVCGGVFAVLAFVTVLTVPVASARISTRAFLVPAAFAFAAGYLAVPGGLEASGHLAVFTGLLAVAIAFAGLHARTAADALGGAAATATIGFLIAAGAWGVTLLLGQDAAIAAALVLGIAPVALRVLPLTCIDVPEGQLLEYSTFKQQLWSVREPTPEPSRPVTASDMAGTMSRARLQLRLGTILFSFAPAAALPVLLAAPTEDVAVAVARVVLVATTVLALLLAPRRANGVVERWSPRAGAGLVGLEFALSSAGTMSSTTLGITAAVLLVIALIVAAISIPLSRGARSLGISRFGDIGEGMSVLLSFPAAFVASGLIDILRGALS